MTPLDELDKRLEEIAAEAEEERTRIAKLTPREYPPKPEAYGGQYLSERGWAVPARLGKWVWSSDFGKWGRLVEFYSGWYGYTFPRTYGD